MVFCQDCGWEIPEEYAKRIARNDHWIELCGICFDSEAERMSAKFEMEQSVESTFPIADGAKFDYARQVAKLHRLSKSGAGSRHSRPAQRSKKAAA